MSYEEQLSRDIGVVLSRYESSVGADALLRTIARAIGREGTRLLAQNKYIKGRRYVRVSAAMISRLETDE